MAGAGAAGRAVQNELQEGISAHASNEQTDEYWDDFESDEDGMLNGIEEELTEGNSGAASTGKSVAVGSPLLNDDASQKLSDLENEAADDLTLSFHEKKLQKIMVLEGDNILNDRKDGKEECLEGQNEGNGRKNNGVLSAAEEVPCDSTESDDLPIHELHKKRNQEEKQPTAKPRLHKQRNASSSDQDHKTLNTSDLKLEDNGRKSPSVIEQMMTTAYEKTRELENTTADSSDGTVKIEEGQIITDTMQEVSMNGQSEHREAKNASKSSVKKPSETRERVLQNSKSSLSDRSPSSVHLKTKVKTIPSPTPVSSQYLGALKLLEGKCMQKKRTEFDKADSLRAAVFQNWLEKKKLFLMELKRTEKKKAENLRNDTEKKEALRREESIACFEAWKKKKAREAKKLSEKKKLEELEEKTPAEQNKEKTEAAQAFKRWKERKVEYLREQSRKEKESERIRKEKEEELMAEKRRVSISAVEKWNEKKEEYIKKKKVEKLLERKKQEMQQAKKEEKNEKAMEEYERWLGQPSLKGQLTRAQNLQSQTASPAATENKERREKLEKKQKKLRSVHGNEMSPPWRPPGKVTYSGNY